MDSSLFLKLKNDEDMNESMDVDNDGSQTNEFESDLTHINNDKDQKGLFPKHMINNSDSEDSKAQKNICKDSAANANQKSLYMEKFLHALTFKGKAKRNWTHIGLVENILSPAVEQMITTYFVENYYDDNWKDWSLPSDKNLYPLIINTKIVLAALVISLYVEWRYKFYEQNYESLTPVFMKQLKSFLSYYENNDYWYSDNKKLTFNTEKELLFFFQKQLSSNYYQRRGHEKRKKCVGEIMSVHWLLHSIERFKPKKHYNKKDLTSKCVENIASMAIHKLKSKFQKNKTRKNKKDTYEIFTEKAHAILLSTLNESRSSSLEVLPPKIDKIVTITCKHENQMTKCVDVIRRQNQRLQHDKKCIDKFERTLGQCTQQLKRKDDRIKQLNKDLNQEQSIAKKNKAKLLETKQNYNSEKLENERLYAHVKKLQQKLQMNNNNNSSNTLDQSVDKDIMKHYSNAQVVEITKTSEELQSKKTASSSLPQYLNATLPLNRYDLIIQFIINYVSSCGLHGSCWKQIIQAINEIQSHQIHTNKNKNLSSKIKSMTYPNIPKTDSNFNSHSSCSFWHSFYVSESNNNHIHKSHKHGSIYLNILNQFISYVKDIHQTSNKSLPFKFYLIDKRIQHAFASKQTDNENGKLQIKITSNGICYPCMENRKEISFDDIYARYNKFIKQTQYSMDNNNTNTSKSLNDILLSVCFICDIYIVSNIELRYKFVGIHSIKYGAYDALQYCILEQLGINGINGTLQTDLVRKLNTNINNMLNATKHLEDIALIVNNNNYLWLAEYKCQQKH